MGEWTPQMAPTSVGVPGGGSSCFLLQEALQDQQVGFSRLLSKRCLWAGTQSTIFLVHLEAQSLCSLQCSSTPVIRSHCPHCQMFWKLGSSGRTPRLGSSVWRSDLSLWEESLQLWLSFFLWVVYPSLLEKAMAPHSSPLAWKIPWTEEPGRLQSMGSRRVGLDWMTPLSLFTFMHWRRKWQPTPVFLPGESQGRGSLVGMHRVGHGWSDLAAAAPDCGFWLCQLHSSYPSFVVPSLYL